MPEIVESVAFALRWSGLCFFLGIVVSYFLWICIDTKEGRHHPAFSLSITCGILLLVWTAYWTWRGLVLS